MFSCEWVEYEDSRGSPRWDVSVPHAWGRSPISPKHMGPPPSPARSSRVVVSVEANVNLYSLNIPIGTDCFRKISNQTGDRTVINLSNPFQTFSKNGATSAYQQWLIVLVMFFIFAGQIWVSFLPRRRCLAKTCSTSLTCGLSLPQLTGGRLVTGGKVHWNESWWFNNDIN